MKKWGLFFAITLLVTTVMHAQTPGGVAPNLKVWLKADLGPEKSAGVPAVDGDAISRWLDESGSGLNYVAVTGPTLKAATINNNPVVQILAGGFDAPIGSELTNDWTVFFVSRKLASNPNGRLYDGHTGNYLWGYWGAYTNSIYLNGSPSNYNSGIATTTGVQNLHLHTYKRESTGGTLEARADGTSLTTFGSSNSANGIRIDIDAGNYASGEHSDAQVGEMIMYTSSLTTTQVNQVESYLAIKYGITLSHDYLASDGSTIWSLTTNTGYNNNIGGIGRDDNSGLSQTKSTSINAGSAVTMDKGGVFGTDKSFIVWGNNSGSGTSANVPSGFAARSARVWKTAVSGSPGTVSFSIDLSAVSLPNTGNASNYTLLIDADGDFSSGATQHTTGVSLVGSILSFTGVSLSDGNFLSIGLSGVSRPGGVSGDMAIWLKANSGVEKSAGVPAGNGDAISRWLDQSGYSNHYVAVAGPTLQNSTLNFNPSVEILSGGFDAPVGSELSNDWTVFFISEKLASDNNGRLFDGNSGNYLWAHWGTYTNSIYLNGNPSNYNSGIATTSGIQNLHLHTYKRESTGGTLEARADGTSLTTFGSSNSANGIRIDINQGAFAGTESSNSRVGEMIMFRAALTSTDINKIESYLGVKYGITLSHNYLASDGTMIWDVTSNAAYGTNITGIGRDDASGLDQEKSASINSTAAVTMDKGGAFGNDKNFIVWGNDNGSGTSNNVPSGYILRSNRVWKVAVTGSPGTVSLSVDLTKIGVANSGSASDYALLIDNDTDFSSGATAHTTGASLVGNVLSFSSVSLSDGNYFTIAAHIPAPGGVVGNVFWVKADAGVTGTTNVSNWADQSGAGNDAMQGVAANQPSLVNNSLNFNPVIDFSDASDIMQLTTPPANLNSTIFTVAVPTSNASWRTLFRGTAGDHAIIVQSGGTALGYYDSDVGSFKTSGFTWLQGEPAVVSLEMRTGDVNYRKNGAQGASIGSINLSGLNLNNFGNYQGGGQKFGQVAETIIYNTSSALTATDKQKIESYLALKYGVTLTENYLASDGTTVWDLSTNTGYNTNIAGIGRDDNTGLNQQKSKSSNTGGGVTIDKGSSFASDKNFVIWGSNGSNGTSNNAPAGFAVRSARIWKTVLVGSPGAVNFSVDLSAIGIVNTGSASDYALLLDTDTDFSSGSTAYTTGASLVGNTLSFTGVSFTSGNYFSIAAMNIPTPGGVAGSVFWVKANMGVTGTTNVSNWSDESGNGNDAAQATGAIQPSLVNNGLNFNPVVDFSDPNDVMTITTPPASLNTTVFTVGVPASGTGTWRAMLKGTTSDWPLIIQNGTPTLGYYDTGLKSSGFNWAPGEPAVVSVELFTGDANYRKNGAQGSSISTISLTGKDIRYLGNNTSGQRFGQIAEVMAFNTASPLSTTDKQKIESYLGVKYGITLTHNYLASDATVLWDVTANASYSNNITGIGRDDNAGLSQPKSKSANSGGALTMDKGGAFGADKNFLLWGSNNINGSSNNVSSSYSVRSARIWKTAVTGTPGSVTLSVDLSAIGLTNTGSASDYALLIDTDIDFSSGATAWTTGASLVGNTLSFTGVNLADGNYLAIAAANVPTPGGVAGNVFWVKADAGVTGTTNVSNWADQSGNGNDATQGTGANQPSLVTNFLNFNPVMDFSDATDIMNVTTPPANLNSTIFTVAVPAANSSWRTMFRGAASDHPIIVQSGGTSLGYFDGDNVGFKSSGFTWLQSEPAVVALEMRSGDVNFRKNGTQGSSITTINLAGLNLDYFGNYQGGGQKFGQIAETIIYNTASALSTPDKEKIESYLALKYGITLTHSYYASDASILWDVTANAGYSNNIAGIGRDDNASLNQQKSKSVNSGGALTLDHGGAFASNMNFIIWGSNNTNGSSNNVPSTYVVRSARVWKTAVVGTPGSVSFSVDLSAIGLTNTGSASDYALLIDGDGDFSAGATAYTTGASLTGNTLSFTGVNFSNGDYFAIAAMNVPTPGGVAGAVFWVKANAGVTGTTNVSNWADQSGNGNDAVQGTGANQPTLVSNALNFNPVIDFAGSSSVMTLTTPPASLNTTVFTVGLPASGTGTYRSMLRGTSSDLPIIIQNGVMTLGYYDTGLKSSGFTWSQNEPAVVSVEMFTGDVNFRKNGSQGASITTISLGGKDIRYLGNNTTGQRFGQIAETMMFNTTSPLSTTDKQKIESYLAIKYGITLSHNYLTSDGTVLWNTTTNATYGNNIAGIGRDDNASLSQQKSMSVNSGAAVAMDKGGAFSSNKDFLLWGNDNGSGISSNIPAGYIFRTKRIWKVGVNGTPGAITFSVDLSAINLQNTGSASDYALLIDTDTDFSSGSTVYTTGASLVGNTLSFTGVTFANNSYFTIVAKNVALPGGVYGAVFWVRADAGVTGTTNISNWADQSGNANNATQGTAGNQPALVSSDLNFDPAVNFSASSQKMQLTAPPANLNSTIFAVGSPNVNSSWRTMFRGATSDHPIIIQSGGNTLGYYAGGLKSSGFTWLQDEPAIVGLEMRSGDVNFRKNGAQGASITTINLSGLTLDYFGNYQGNGQPFGRINEAIIFNTTSALTTTEKQKVETYLGLKYGLQLSHNYLASDGTTIWDATANATYHHNVAGIGKDVVGGLNQKQSKNQNGGSVVTVGLGSIATDNASNANTFAADKSFFIWGSNSGALNSAGVSDIGTTVNSEVIVARLARVWKSVETGTVGTLKVQFDMSSVPGHTGAGDNDLAKVRLLVDADGVFATGATSVAPSSYDNTTDIVNFDWDFAAGTGFYFTVGTTDLATAPLPLELTKISVESLDHNAALLSWTTASEINSDYFTAQRSQDGEEWESLGIVDAAGNSSQPIQYQYTDRNPYPGQSYYRISLTGIDGKTDYSSVVVLTRDGDDHNLLLYPNPAQGSFIIQSDAPEAITVTLTNELGQNIPIHIKNDGSKLVIPTGDLPRGTYIVSIQRGHLVARKKLILN